MSLNLGISPVSKQKEVYPTRLEANLPIRFVVKESLSGLVASCRTSTPSMAGGVVSCPVRGQRIFLSGPN
jgi:hypothetical protein